MDEPGDPAQRLCVLITPDAKVTECDSAFGRDSRRLNHYQ
jgi:hypothetical protein